MKQHRLARRTVNAKGLGSISAALTMAEKLGRIAVNPCSEMGLKITEADVVKREPYSLEDRIHPRGRVRRPAPSMAGRGATTTCAA